MKKLFILLFPENDFLRFDTKTISLFNECIELRYIKNNYDFCIINHKNSKSNYITIQPSFIIEDSLTFEQASKLEDKLENNLKKLAQHSSLNNYSHIVIGGFLCFDCVEKFATQLLSNSKNVTIDTDLTDLFEANIRDKDWNIWKFCPDKKLKKLLQYKNKLTLDVFGEIVEKCSVSIWGISQNLIDELEIPLLQN